MRARTLLSDDALRQMQNDLMADSHKGDVMPACGGLRKLRVADSRRGKGTRGGVRVVYLNLPEAARIELIALYSKDERDDLNEQQKRTLRVLAEQARLEANEAVRRKAGPKR